MGMKAIVFSNFPDELLERELKPKLKDVGVQVLRSYKPDRLNSAAIEGEDADAVIAFTDLMSHGQFDAISRRAKRWCKPILGLKRQSAKWSEALKPVLDGVERKNKSLGTIIKEWLKENNTDTRELAMKTKTTIDEVNAWKNDEKLPAGPQFSRLKHIIQELNYSPIAKLIHAKAEPEPVSQKVPAQEDDDMSQAAITVVKSSLSTFRQLADKGADEEEILHSMQLLWRPFSSFGEVEEAIERHLKVDRGIPPSFKTWWQDRKAPVSAPPKTQPRLSVVPSSPEPPPSSQGSGTLEERLQQHLELETMYETEIKRLSQELEAQKKERREEAERHEVTVTELKRRNDALNALSDSLRKSHDELAQKHAAELADLDRRHAEALAAKAQPGGLEKLVGALKTALEAGILTEEEVSRKLFDYLFKK